MRARTLVLVAAALAVVVPTGQAAELPRCDGARPGAVLVAPLVPPFDPRPYPTFGFMFNGNDGHVYATTAGHVALGTQGGERRWNGDGSVLFDIDGNRVGVFVYAIDTRTAGGEGLPRGADLSLIRVDAGVPVETEVCGVGGPRGVDDRVLTSPGLVEHRWFGATVMGGRIGHPIPTEGPWLRPQRSGVSVGMPDAHTVTVAGYASFGDSGAPVLSDDDRAVGWISGPPRSPDELAQPGTFVVSRIAPAIERAEIVLGISLSLATP